MKKLISVLLALSLAVSSAWLPVYSAQHTDVPAGTWYYAAVEEASQLNLMDALTEGKFAPDTAADRGTVVEALWRMAGSPIHTNELPFTDLADARYTDSVRWSYATEVVNGTSATTFSPKSNVTRAQLTTLMFRYLNYMGGNTGAGADLSTFPDAAQVPEWAQAAMAWACGAGIIQGTTGEGGVLKLDPNGNTTRAQLATVLLRFRNQFLDDPAEDEAYKTIPGRECTSFKTGYYGIPEASAALYLKYPDDWTLQEADGPKFDILRSGKVIGALQAGTPETKGWKTVSQRTITYGDYLSREYVDKTGLGKSLAFRYRYEHEYSENGSLRTITVTVDAAEMGESIRSAMYSSSELKNAGGAKDFGTLSELKNGRLLLVGNSFISTSEIGNTLSTMLKRGSVKAVSQGYATVSTFAKDTALLASIRSGNYNAVFLCGLYSASEVAHVETIRAACAAGGAKLILMPAYNESRSAIQQAVRTYPDIPLLDWKGEIEDLIASGKSKWDFCINDQHTHSTPLAGYVGAHMIYRAIYGEVPSIGATGTVGKATIDRVLEDYPATGVLRKLDPALITPLQ